MNIRARRRGAPPAAPAPTLLLNLRVDRALGDRLDAVTARLPLSRHRIAILAMERGLAQIERNPAVLIGPPPPKARRAPGHGRPQATRAPAPRKGARR